MAKKDFKKAVLTTAAAERFFIEASTPNADNTGTADNTGSLSNADTTQYTHSTAKRSKSKRVQLLVYPDILEAAKKAAYMNESSINAVINELLADYVQRNAEQVATYEKLFNKVK